MAPQYPANTTNTPQCPSNIIQYILNPPNTLIYAGGMGLGPGP